MHSSSTFHSTPLPKLFVAAALAITIPASGCEPDEGEERESIGAEQGPNEGPNGEEGDEGDVPNENNPTGFTFAVPGTNEAAHARVVNGTSIEIQRFPKRFGFKLDLGLSPGSIGLALDAEFCEKVEGYVEQVEDEGDDAEKALQKLRKSHQPESLKVWFGEFFVAEMLRVARDAASSAGSSASGLRIKNKPEYQDLAIGISFDNNALTPRVGDQEEAIKDFEAQLEETLPLPAPGLLRLETAWTDLVCDLYTGRAKIEVTMKEQGWETVAESQGFK